MSAESIEYAPSMPYHLLSTWKPNLSTLESNETKHGQRGLGTWEGGERSPELGQGTGEAALSIDAGVDVLSRGRVVAGHGQEDAWKGEQERVGVVLAGEGREVIPWRRWGREGSAWANPLRMPPWYLTT